MLSQSHTTGSHDDWILTGVQVDPPVDPSYPDALCVVLPVELICGADGGLYLYNARGTFKETGGYIQEGV